MEADYLCQLRRSRQKPHVVKRIAASVSIVTVYQFSSHQNIDSLSILQNVNVDTVKSPDCP